ncbi:uncharacterized protein LOC129317771 [Prosopis cineraria]|uniref:uncharacterized protein LOC129317771 n=1 Tax=Prosopis cineraria TaxID=364024 RepID=UPI00240ECB0D|nr:uncharacterized protein LOC129317771 [Prosopis cineraria]
MEIPTSSSCTEKDKKSEVISGGEAADSSEDSNNMPVPVSDEKEEERTKQLNNHDESVREEEEAERTGGLTDEPVAAGEEKEERTRETWRMTKEEDNKKMNLELSGDLLPDVLEVHDNEAVEEEAKAESTKGLTNEPVKEQETERIRGIITTDDEPAKEDQEAAETKIGLTDEPVREREAERSTRVIIGADHGEDKKKETAKKAKKKILSIRLAIRFISWDFATSFLFKYFFRTCRRN